MDKLFLLDAYALIYRSYYAFIKNPRINSKGLNTSAIMGFCNTLNEVLEKEKPTHIGVAFDPHGPTFRNEAYPAYKAQREETPEDIRASVPIIKDILRAYRIPILQVDGYEADDVIGTLALRLSGNSDDSGNSDISVYMLTPAIPTSPSICLRQIKTMASWYEITSLSSVPVTEVDMKRCHPRQFVKNMPFHRPIRSLIFWH